MYEGNCAASLNPPSPAEWVSAKQYAIRTGYALQKVRGCKRIGV